MVLFTQLKYILLRKMNIASKIYFMGLEALNKNKQLSAEVVTFLLLLKETTNIKIKLIYTLNI